MTFHASPLQGLNTAIITAVVSEWFAASLRFSLHSSVFLSLVLMVEADYYRPLGHSYVCSEFTGKNWLKK